MWMKLQKLEESLSCTASNVAVAPFNGSSVYGTYDMEVVRNGKGNRKMAQNPHDSQKEDELIMSRRILIYIYEGKNKKKGKIYSKML